MSPAGRLLLLYVLARRPEGVNGAELALIAGIGRRGDPMRNLARMIERLRDLGLDVRREGSRIWVVADLDTEGLLSALRRNRV